MENMLTTAEAAKAKGVSQSTLARWCADGWLKCYKVGKTWLVNKSELEAFEPPKRGPKKKEDDTATS
jgi:excisionase family DNA binding protein